MRDYIINFTTKEDGNIAFHVGDNISNIISNQKKLAKKLGYKLEDLVYMKQVHGDDVLIVDNSFNFDNPPTCDGLITNLKGKPLMVMVADCTPILFYDKKRKAIGAVHAGRAGAFKNIVSKTVALMMKKFNSQPEDLVVHLGPSIEVCCYEINQDIKKEAFSLGYGFAVEDRDNRIFLDVSKILEKQLTECGVENTNMDNRCSACNHTSLFSYRKDKIQGRMAGVIMLT